jgi:hypothetical protein
MGGQSVHMKKKSLLVVAVVAALALFGSVGAAIALNSANPTSTQVDQPQTSAPADTDTVECENGIDPTGAACADDDAAEVDEPEAEDPADTDTVECENGIDPTTGLECDGGPAANIDNDDQGAVDHDDQGTIDDDDQVDEAEELAELP